jgi:multidrug resistance efflux pump
VKTVEKTRAKVHEHQQAPVDPPAAKNDIMHRMRSHPFFLEVLIVIAVVIISAGLIYWQELQSRIYIENAEISAPIISLTPQASGKIDEFYVQEGDKVLQGQRIARVGEQIITAKTFGVIIWLDNALGQVVSSQTTVAKMIDPRDFKLVGRIEEDKGLSRIQPGQKVIFTVDAFGGKEYQGFVDSIGLTAVQQDIVFSISDKRQEKEFEVRAVFDTSEYPELKNGMSAKMLIYLNEYSDQGMG